jgi:hypothetical protein
MMEKEDLLITLYFLKPPHFCHWFETRLSQLHQVFCQQTDYNVSIKGSEWSLTLQWIIALMLNHDQ